MTDVKALNDKYSLQQGADQLCFKLAEGGIPIVEIENKFASAIISLQGAHVLSWKEKNKAEVIWLSEDATFALAKSVRGGIPICWPWFGAHENEASFPSHGFARTVFWQVANVVGLPTGETQITFRLVTNELDEKIQAMWPQATVAEYSLTIGETLTIELTTINNSDESITIGQALHTYFKIDDVANTTISGLEDKTYLDKTENFKSKVQKGVITIDSEVDRVYIDTTEEVIIDDAKRKISICKQGSKSTVVWNPWQAVAEKMGDLGKAGYRKMLCVESANAANDVVNIKAGGRYTLLVSYKIL